jgi:hypothetical protein
MADSTFVEGERVVAFTVALTEAIFGVVVRTEGELVYLRRDNGDTFVAAASRVLPHRAAPDPEPIPDVQARLKVALAQVRVAGELAEKWCDKDEVVWSSQCGDELNRALEEARNG